MAINSPLPRASPGLARAGGELNEESLSLSPEPTAGSPGWYDGSGQLAVLVQWPLTLLGDPASPYADVLQK